MKGFLDGRVIPVSPGILIGMGQSQPDMWVKIVHISAAENNANYPFPCELVARL